MKTPTIDSIMSTEQKKLVIEGFLRARGAPFPFKVRINRTFAWDFEVRMAGEQALVTFACSMSDPRMAFLMDEIVRAMHDFQTSTHAVAIMGEAREEEKS